jgi:spore germination protein KB
MVNRNNIGKKMPGGQIANRQLLSILFIMRSTLAIAFLPVVTTGNARQDAWAAGLLTGVCSALITVAIGGLGPKFPDKTVVEYSQELLGTFLGKFVSLIYLTVFLLLASIDVRVYGEVLVTGFIPETPLLFIISTMVIASTYAAFHGVEIIARNAEFVFPLFAGMLLVTFVAAIPSIDIGRLQPVLARGVKPILIGSITPISVVLQMMTLPFLLPRVREPSKAVNTAIWAVVLASVLLAAGASITIGVLGADLAERSVFPFFVLARAIRLTDFLERLEALIVFPWGFGLFIGVAVYIYCGAKGLSQVFGLKDYRPLLPAMAVIWIAMSLHLATDVFELTRFLKPDALGPLALFLIGIPQGLLWLAYGVKTLLSRMGG